MRISACARSPRFLYNIFWRWDEAVLCAPIWSEIDSGKGCKIVSRFGVSRDVGAIGGLAGAEGLEPTTYGFGDRRSTN